MRKKINYLFPEEVEDMIEKEIDKQIMRDIRKDLRKDLRKQRAYNEKEQKLAKSESTYGKLKAGIKQEAVSSARALFRPEKVSRARINQLKNFQVGQQLNAEQGFLRELFGSGQRALMPDEDTLPPATINHSLMPNFGGMEIDDGETTANCFGFGSNHSTRRMFGI